MQQTGIEKGKDTEPYPSNPVSDLVPFNDWLASLGRSKVSGWRYRRAKMVSTVVLLGRVFDLALEGAQVLVHDLHFLGQCRVFLGKGEGAADGKRERQCQEGF